MRKIIITCLLSALTITGCSLFGEIQTNTKPMHMDDLSVKHIYKIPKNKSRAYFKYFNDSQLDQLVSVALLDAPNINSAKIRVTRAQQLTKIAYSTLWPAMNLNGYVDKAYFPIHGTLPPDIRPFLVDQANIEDIGFKFNYELDFWGKNRATLASKVSETYAAQMELAETRLMLSTAVATTYFDIQNNMILQRLARENVRLLKQLADIILDREKQGIESNIPVKTALANYQTAILSVEDYKRAEIQSRHQLAVLMGKNPFTTQIEIVTFRYDKRQLILPKIIPANILAQRPDIASARALTESAAHQIHVAKTAFFPNINLRGLLSLQSIYFNQAFNIWLQNDHASAAFDLPVFDAGARRANLGVSYAQYELSVNQYNQTILHALQQVSDQLAALKTLNTQITAQNQALNNIESNYKLFRARYTQGIIDYTQLIEIKQLLIQKKAILQQLQTRQKQAFIALLAALGGEL